MELSEVLRTLAQRRLAVLAVFAIAVAVGVLAAYKPVGGTLVPRSQTTGIATKQFLVESPRSPLTDLRAETAPQNDRTGAFAQVLSSPALREGIERQTGIPAETITAEGPFKQAPNSPGVVRPSEVRGLEIDDEAKAYRIRIITPVELPIVSIHARGPNAEEAARLANGTFAALKSYVNPLAAEIHPAPTYPVILRDLGPAQAGASGGGMGKAAVVLGFCATFLLGLMLIVCVEVARRGLRPTPRPAAAGPSLTLPRTHAPRRRSRR